MLQVTFAEVVRVLEGLGSSVPAPEAHGCLVGALCTSHHYSMERWLEEIIPDEEHRNDDDSQQALRLLYADTLNALRGEEMEFEVLLPDDDIPLAERAGGLSQWCQGFLYGFGTGQAQERAYNQSHDRSDEGGAYADADEQEDETAREDPETEERDDQLPDTVTEILNDLTHIGRASVELDGDIASEAEEEAYAEVVEYVRVGVQLIHDELIPALVQRVDNGAPGSNLDMDDSEDIDPSTLH